MWFKSECNKISDRLWDYSARRLSDAETAQVESHLQQCTHCQAEANAYQQTLGMLGAARSLPVPASQTTWRDLRPSLAPNRRPVLRSADFLPRLTLAGAGTALAATLLVVFMSGGHHPRQIGNTRTNLPDRQPVAARGPVTPPTAPTEVASDNTSRSSSDSAFNALISNAYNGAIGLSQASNPVEKSPTPKAPTLRIRHSLGRGSHLTSNAGRSRSAASEDTKPQLEGDNVSPRAQQNYVLTPVSSEEETAHHYVISSISTSNGGAVASNDEEGRAW